MTSIDRNGITMPQEAAVCSVILCIYLVSGAK